MLAIIVGVVLLLALIAAYMYFSGFDATKVMDGSTLFLKSAVTGRYVAYDPVLKSVHAMGAGGAESRIKVRVLADDPAGTFRLGRGDISMCGVDEKNEIVGGEGCGYYMISDDGRFIAEGKNGSRPRMMFVPSPLARGAFRVRYVLSPEDSAKLQLPQERYLQAKPDGSLAIGSTEEKVESLFYPSFA